MSTCMRDFAEPCSSRRPQPRRHPLEVFAAWYLATSIIALPAAMVLAVAAWWH